MGGSVRPVPSDGESMTGKKKEYNSHCWATRAKLVKVEHIRKTIKTYYCPKCDAVYSVVVEDDTRKG